MNNSSGCTREREKYGRGTDHMVHTLHTRSTSLTKIMTRVCMWNGVGPRNLLPVFEKLDSGAITEFLDSQGI